MAKRAPLPSGRRRSHKQSPFPDTLAPDEVISSAENASDETAARLGPIRAGRTSQSGIIGLGTESSLSSAWMWGCR